MKIFLIRHCSTEQSKNQFIKDDDGDFSLSSAGILEAKKLQIFFKKIKIDNIFISDTKRSKETASIVFPQHKEKFITIGEFNEMDKGFKNFLAVNPDKEKMNVINWENVYNNGVNVSKIKFKYPSGRSIDSYSKIVVKKFFELIVCDQGSNLAIVAHNGPIKSIISHILGDIKVYTKFFVYHGAYSEIFCDDNNCKLISLNKL